MNSKIIIRQFNGADLKPYLHSIAKMRCDVYREYPYLYNVSFDHEIDYLENHLINDDATAVIAFDNSTIIGVSTGAPLENEPFSIQTPFIEKGLDISSFYYLGKSFLLKPYRGRGIWHHFFDLREQYVIELGRFQHVCFSNIERPLNDPLRPKDYLPTEDFWKKRGYVNHPGMRYILRWQDSSESFPSDKAMIIWTKDLPNYKPRQVPTKELATVKT